MEPVIVWEFLYWSDGIFTCLLRPQVGQTPSYGTHGLRTPNATAVFHLAVWNVYVDAPRGLIIAGIVVFAIYCLAGLAYMFRRGNYWQYLYRPLGIAVCVKGISNHVNGIVHFTEQKVGHWRSWTLCWRHDMGMRSAYLIFRSGSHELPTVSPYKGSVMGCFGVLWISCWTYSRVSGDFRH